MLAYDERMTLHAEGIRSSHPERPDRVRAVMARLAASGLTGCACSDAPVTCSLLLPLVHVHLCKHSRIIASFTRLRTHSDTHVTHESEGQADFLPYPRPKGCL